MGYLFKKAFFVLDSRSPSQKSVKDFLKRNVMKAYNLKRKGIIPTFSGCNDEKVRKIHKWVMDRIVYCFDLKSFGRMEYWSDVDTTLNSRSGDCEDGAVLIYCIARVNNISPSQIRLCAGLVRNPSGKGLIGHCWVEYCADETFKFQVWYPIDWCYFPDTRKFSEKFIKLRNVDKYVSKWFEVTDF